MRVLIIRLSSFGDILQTLPAIDALAANGYSVSYLTKKNFSSLVKHHPKVETVIELHGKGSLLDLWRTARVIHSKKFSHIYDAHNNLRSYILKFFLFVLGLKCGRFYHFLTRSKNRWKRFLFFKLRRPVFKMPFRGANSFLEPLKKWDISYSKASEKHLYLPPTQEIPQLPPLPFVTIAPSAAWATKRWPEKHWIELVRSVPHIHFVILGGPEDLFCNDIHKASPTNSTNLAGSLSLLQSCAAVEASSLLISGDTGLLHAADQLRKKCIALIGPTAFGYPFNDSSVILETELICKPCSKDGRDPCINSIYQKCMVDLSPKMVAATAQKILGGLQ